MTVTDIKMRFGSMVLFMVKWAIASIPALLILVTLGAVVWGLVLALAVSVRSPLRQRSGSPVTSAASASSRDSNTSAASNPEQATYISKVVVRNVKIGQSVLGETGVFGEVKNTGDRTLRNVEITIYCLGSDGRPVFEKTYNPVLVTEFGLSADNQPLKPSYSRQFGVKMDDAPSDWTRKVDVKVTKVEFQ